MAKLKRPLVVCKIGGDERDKPKLGQLCRLELHLCEAEIEHHPEPGSVDFEAFDRQDPIGRKVGKKEKGYRDQNN